MNALLCRLLALFALLATVSAASAAANTLPGRVIVKFKETASARAQILSAGRGSPDADAVRQVLAARASALGQRQGLALRAGQPLSERVQVLTAEGIGDEALAARLVRDADVEYAVPDRRRRALLVPNDPFYVPTSPPPGGPAVGQWYLKPPAASRLVSGDEILSAINAEGAWDISTGSSSVIVAVLDTGVRYDHPDLAGKLLPGYDMVSDSAVSNDGDGRDADASDPGDWVSLADKSTDTFSDCDVANSSWHGTLTAGLIGAATDNNLGMAGAGWNVRVLPVRVLGKCFGYDSDIIAGMRWAAGVSIPTVPTNPSPAKVLNMSLGGDGSCSAAYKDVLAELAALNVVVVAAAGNSTGHAVGVPANCPGVIGVAALRHIGTKVGFSDVGAEITISAPGGNCGLAGSCQYPLLSTSNTGNQSPAAATYSDSSKPSVGTSFSSPLVAATVALMRSVNASLSVADVTDILKRTARAFPFRGAPADADTGAAVPVCRAPNGVDQLQCYCTSSTCGAGMLNMAWAVYTAASDAPRLAVTAAAQPLPGQAMTLSVAATAGAAGSASALSAAGTARPSALTAAQWTLLDGGGIVAGFDGGGTTATGNSVTVTPSGAGKFTVRVLATDSGGAQGFTEQTFDVVAPSSGGDGGGGGGGAASLLWSFGLLAAAAALRRRR